MIRAGSQVPPDRLNKIEPQDTTHGNRDEAIQYTDPPCRVAFLTKVMTFGPSDETVGKNDKDHQETRLLPQNQGRSCIPHHSVIGLRLKL